jgi:hypothetical protein
MTNDQINWAITEAIGADPHWKCAKDYCNDLNAMAEAEKTLSSAKEKMYFATLKEIVGDLIWHRTTGKVYRATARQRAEAFLLTLGKWSATTEESSAVQKEVQG